MGEDNDDNQSRMDKSFDVSTSIKRRVENAWACDQAILLDAEAELLDNVIYLTSVARHITHAF